MMSSQPRININSKIKKKLSTRHGTHAGGPENPEIFLPQPYFEKTSAQGFLFYQS
jgi:hypothetical protein